MILFSFCVWVLATSCGKLKLCAHLLSALFGTSAFNIKICLPRFTYLGIYPRVGDLLLFTCSWSIWGTKRRVCTHHVIVWFLILDKLCCLDYAIIEMEQADNTCTLSIPWEQYSALVRTSRVFQLLRVCFMTAPVFYVKNLVCEAKHVCVFVYPHKDGEHVVHVCVCICDI